MSAGRVVEVERVAEQVDALAAKRGHEDWCSIEWDGPGCTCWHADLRALAAAIRAGGAE